MRNERTHIRNIQTIWRMVENITLDELSKQSGLSSGQLRKWESGKGMIKTSHEKVHFCESYKDSGKFNPLQKSGKSNQFTVLLPFFC